MRWSVRCTVLLLIVLNLWAMSAMTDTVKPIYVLSVKGPIEHGVSAYICRRGG